MAKLKGHVKYNGTIGEIRHFKIKGQDGYFAGMVGGPSGQQIKTGAEFERTRENMNEFGGCARASKSVRNALSAVIRHVSDTQMTGRLTGIMKKINLEDGTEARGYRKVEISTQRNQLKGFNFDRNLNFRSVYTGPIDLFPDADRNAADLVLPAFSPTEKLTPPAGATHFRIIHALAVVSDFAFSTMTNSYEPVTPELNELSVVEYSSYIPIYEAFAGETLVAELPGAPVMTPDVSVLHCMGIEFAQRAGTQFYRFQSGNCMFVNHIF